MKAKAKSQTKKGASKLKKKSNKLTEKQVQDIFNAMVRRRDERCIITGVTKNLDCSHFYNIERNRAIKYYPRNAYAMSKKVHFVHHYEDPFLYPKWIERHDPEGVEWMKRARKRSIKYTQEVLTHIAYLCAKDKVVELEQYIEDLIGIGSPEELGQ